jgi:hypothetical protein
MTQETEETTTTYTHLLIFPVRATSENTTERNHHMTDIDRLAVPTPFATVRHRECQHYGYLFVTANRDGVWMTHDYSTGPNDCQSDYFGITDPATVMQFACELITAALAVMNTRDPEEEALRVLQAAFDARRADR